MNIFTNNQSGIRLDQMLQQNMPDHSRSYLKKMIQQGHVTVNQQLVQKAGYALLCEDIVVVNIPEPQHLNLEAEPISLDIVYEDEHLIVINKPQNMVVHPTTHQQTGTLVNALLYHAVSLSTIGGVIRPGIVHRLDKDTSGLLVVAKNDKTHRSLSMQLADKTCRRTYRALVHGIVNETGEINTPIWRDPHRRVLMAIAPKGKGRNALTYYRLVFAYQKYSLVELDLQTGRTHQIRVHMKSIHHPVVGDPLYGKVGGQVSSSGQLLHACKLSFIHPSQGHRVTFESPLPPHFLRVLEQLKNL